MSDDTPTPRSFPPDTRMGDLPDDLTAEESLALFGTEFDESTVKLRTLSDMLLGPSKFVEVMHRVKAEADQVFKIEPDDRLFEVMPKGRLIDLITVGLLAHEILQRVVPGDGEASPLDAFTGGGNMAGGGVHIHAVRLSDLLNGKGPFGGDLKNRDDDDT